MQLVTPLIRRQFSWVRLRLFHQISYSANDHTSLTYLEW